MATLHIPLVSRTSAAVDWLADADLEALDEAAEAAYARRERIEAGVDFGDLLEECCEFTPVQRQEFMKALARGNAQDLHLIHCLLDQAKETIVKRRLAEGE
jgi:hypothetical protein